MKFPYKKYEDSALWSIIEIAVNNLVRNSDIEEKTERGYI